MSRGLRRAGRRLSKGVVAGGCRSGSLILERAGFSCFSCVFVFFFFALSFAGGSFVLILEFFLLRLGWVGGGLFFPLVVLAEG